MAKLIEMPKLSPTMEEGQIAAWHKEEGARVEVDELLAEVETDKATMEFRSFDRGVLLKILAPAGSLVKLGDPVAVMGEAGEDISALLAGIKKAPPATKVEKAPPKEPREKPAPTPSAPPPAPLKMAPPPSVGSSGRVKASPYVRKLARERGVDLRVVAGSGPGGRIVARDLERAPAPALVAVPAPSSREPESRPLSMTRRTIARRLTESKQQVPHFYLRVDVDAEPLSALRANVNADLAAAPEQEGEPLKLSFNDFVLKACAIALVRVPECNASFTPEAILLHRRVDVSVAVAVDEGLLTPVVRDADGKSVLEISREVRDLAARARAKKLKIEEMTGGTFSLSNLGMYGIDEFAAIINPPEGAILAVGAIRETPVIRDGAVEPGKRMALTLSCDHRVVDGAVGAKFLAELRAILEHPSQILLW